MSCAVHQSAMAEWSGLGLLHEGASGVPLENHMAASFEGFSRRLHQALDNAGFVKGRLRTGELARENNVSRETARKWLSGLALPELERMIGLAVQASVSFEWLATGRGEMVVSNSRVGEGGGEYHLSNDEARLARIIHRLPNAKRSALLVLLDQ